MNIFFDLDGTLLDSRHRLYKLFQSLVPSSEFSFDAYWELKRNKTGHAEILKNQFHFSHSETEEFEKKWMEQIELPEWLGLDKPFAGVTGFLNELKTNNSLYVVTARQFENETLQQIDGFGWTGVFEKILITGQKEEKINLIRKAMDPDPTDWMVGDTGKDIQAGKALGIRTAAVLSGFLNEKSLLPYDPDVIVNHVTDLDFKLKEA